MEAGPLSEMIAISDNHLFSRETAALGKLESSIPTVINTTVDHTYLDSQVLAQAKDAVEIQLTRFPT